MTAVAKCIPALFLSPFGPSVGIRGICIIISWPGTSLLALNHNMFWYRGGIEMTLQYCGKESYPQSAELKLNEQKQYSEHISQWFDGVEIE